MRWESLFGMPNMSTRMLDIQVENWVGKPGLEIKFGSYWYLVIKALRVDNIVQSRARRETGQTQGKLLGIRGVVLIAYSQKQKIIWCVQWKIKKKAVLC